jgi:hypothetical protein
MTTESSFKGSAHWLDGSGHQENRFEIAIDSREVGLNRFWVDMVALESDIVTESFGSRINGEVVQLTEHEI